MTSDLFLTATFEYNFSASEFSAPNAAVGDLAITKVLGFFLLHKQDKVLRTVDIIHDLTRCTGSGPFSAVADVSSFRNSCILIFYFCSQVGARAQIRNLYWAGSLGTKELVLSLITPTSQ